MSYLNLQTSVFYDFEYFLNLPTNRNYLRRIHLLFFGICPQPCRPGSPYSFTGGPDSPENWQAG